MRTLDEWFIYIDSLHHATIELGLERVRAVAKKLGVTALGCPVITVAGTNGKGSCVALLEALFLGGDYKVGAYYSPHLFRFNERIHLLGQEVTDHALCRAFQQVEDARKDIRLTYFEFTTLAAFLLFQQANLDVIILEVGLGGRLDAVNIIDSDVAVITSIGIDHVNYLGPDRNSIGMEKAGIMRAHRPIVCGDANPPQTLINYAESLSAKFYCLNTDFTFKIKGSTWDWAGGEIELRNLPIPPIHINNAATVLMVLTLLKDNFFIPIDVISSQLTSTCLPGRYQFFDKGIPIIFDVAHNPHAATYLAERLASDKFLGQTLAVFAMLGDKDVAGTSWPLKNIVKHWYIAGLEGARSSDVQATRRGLLQNGIDSISECPDVMTAYQQALADAKTNDRIVIFGSFHTVGPILKTVLYPQQLDFRLGVEP